jgi:hypothetical protein
MLQQVRHFVLPANELRYVRIRLEGDLSRFLPRDREDLTRSLREAAGDNRLFPLAASAGSVVVDFAGPSRAVERLLALGGNGQLAEILRRRVLSIALIHAMAAAHQSAEQELVPGFFSTSAPLLAPSAAGDKVALAGLLGITEHPTPFRFGIRFSGPSRESTGHREQAVESLGYFFDALATPDDDWWVNLGPGEYRRVLPDSLRRTGLGLALLDADLTLKRLTASLLHPSGELGRRFWGRVIERCGATADVEPHFRVWMVPKTGGIKVLCGTDDNDLYVSEALIELVSEEAHGQHVLPATASDTRSGGRVRSPTDQICWEIFAETVLPELRREVNSGLHFAKLRQAFRAMVLAAQCRKKWSTDSRYAPYFEDGLLARPLGMSIDWGAGDAGNFQYAPADPDRVQSTGRGIDEIVAKYKSEFDQGVFYVVRHETCPTSGQALVRSFFSGAAKLRPCSAPGEEREGTETPVRAGMATRC